MEHYITTCLPSMAPIHLIYFHFQGNQMKQQDNQDEEFMDETRDEETPSRLQGSRGHRLLRPPELQEANYYMRRAFTTLYNVLSKRKEDDDCDIFAKLVASKLRKIPETEREDIMYEIHRIVHNRTHRSDTIVAGARPSPSLTYSRAGSTQGSSSTPSPPAQSGTLNIPVPPQYFYTTPSLPFALQNRPCSSLSSFSSPEHQPIINHPRPNPFLPEPGIITSAGTATHTCSLLPSSLPSSNAFNRNNKQL